MTKRTNTKHVALRIKSENGITISEHNKVIDQKGSVLFSKLGKPLSDAFVNQLNNQLDKEIPTYLFLATYEGRNVPYGYYQCNLVRVHKKVTQSQISFIPEYIQHLVDDIETYFEISSINRLSHAETNRIYVLSSGREISGAIRGTTSIFKVGVKGKSTMELVADPGPTQTRNMAADIYDDDDYLTDDKEFVEDWYSHPDS